MATIKKSGNKWVAEVRKRRKGHKDFFRSKTFPKKSHAAEWAAKIEAEFDLEKLGKINTVKTFGDAINKYQADISPDMPSHTWNELRASKLESYPLYNVYLSKLNPEHFNEYKKSRMSDKVSNDTVLRELGYLSGICTYCVKELRWLTENPVSAISKPKPSAPRERRITEDEINSITRELGFKEGQKPVMKKQEVAIIFMLAIETAMRTSEMTTLEWNQVHLDNRYVQLEKTKNGDKRQVPLSKRAIELLRLQEGRDPLNVFQVKSGSVDTLFRKAKKNLEIKNLHFHDTRREATSRLAKKLDVMDLAKMTGHRDLKMLLDVYYKPKASEIATLLD